MKKIKIAQIGIGHDHALELLHCIVNHTDIFEFVGLAIPESEKTDFPKRYEKVAQYHTPLILQVMNSLKRILVLFSGLQMQFTKVSSL